jgi:flagellar basal body rod protein FlgB
MHPPPRLGRAGGDTKEGAHEHLPGLGSVAMQNALLVGLSRQMALSRELDIVANNIANIDTNGYKADNAAFSQFLSSAPATASSTATTGASVLCRTARAGST